MSLVSFEGNSQIVRDTANKAVLSTDRAGLLAHRKQREQAERIDRLERDVADMSMKLDKVLELLLK